MVSDVCSYRVSVCVSVSVCVPWAFSLVLFPLLLLPPLSGSFPHLFFYLSYYYLLLFWMSVCTLMKESVWIWVGEYRCRGIWEELGKEKVLGETSEIGGIFLSDVEF